MGLKSVLWLKGEGLILLRGISLGWVMDALEVFILN
jgi:hypothetical protein